MTNEKFKNLVIDILNVGWYYGDYLVDTKPIEEELNKDEKLLLRLKKQAERIKEEFWLNENDAIYKIFHETHFLERYGKITGIQAV